MAYKWSWAFGPETALELDTLTPWVPSSTSATRIAPVNTIKHTYTGDVSDRYSMSLQGSYYLQGPVGIMSGSGIFSGYFYYNGSTNWDSYDILQIWGPAANRSISLLAKSAKYFDLYINSTLIDTPSPAMSLSDDTWHHVAVKYDMRGAATWGAEVFVDGVSVMSGSHTNAINLDPEVTAYFKIGGVQFSELPTNSLNWSDIIIYDDLADPNPHGQLVTRIKPYTDTADSGSWTPASNGGSPGAQASNLSGSISTTPVVGEANPLTGEHVTVQTQEVATTLGLSSFTSYGFTGHLYASGSSTTNLIAGLEVDAPNAFVTGAAQIDGENMYAWSSDTTTLSSGSVIFLKAEVSGS